jgi:hypothetical protein
MLLGPFNGLQDWQYAQISTQKKYAQISKIDTPEAFFAPKMLKYAPKLLKLMPEILKVKMPIFVTQFNFKVSTNCKQNAPKLS